MLATQQRKQGEYHTGRYATTRWNQAPTAQQRVVKGKTGGVKKGSALAKNGSGKRQQR